MAQSSPPAGRSLAAGAALVSVAVGLVVLFGWFTDVDTLKRIAPSLPSMKADTAIGFVGMGASLWLVRDRAASLQRRRLSIALALAVAVFALLVLVEWAYDVDLGIDHLFSDPEDGSGHPGRTSPHSALAFVAVGLWVASSAWGSRRLVAVSKTMSIVASLVILFAGIGYLYGVDYLTRTPNGNGMALHTLVTFAVLCVGVVAVQPSASFIAGITSSGPGGQVVRLLVPTLVLAASVLGILRAVGRNLDVYGTRTGAGIIVGITLAGGVGAVLLLARRLDRVDEVRRTLEQNLLRRSESRLEAIVETTNNLIATIDEDLVWTYINPASAAIYGFEPAELIGRPVGELAEPAQRADDERAFRRVLDGSVLRGHETMHRRKDGTPVVISFNAVPLLDDAGAPIGAIAAGDDITERWTTAAAVREAHERLDTILDRTPALVFIKDLDGRYTFANRAIEEFFGVPRADLLGKTDAELFPPDVARELLIVDHEVIASGEAVHRQEHVPHPNGPRTYLSIKFPLRNASGVVTEICGVATDITELQQRQDELSVRRDEQAAISDLGAYALRGGAIDELAERAAQTALALVDANGCTVVRLGASGEPQGSWTATGPVAPRERETPRVEYPLVSQGRRLGTLEVLSGGERAFEPDGRRLLQAIANVLASAFDRDDAQQALEERLDEIAQLAAARGRLVAEALDAEDRERARLSEALHDDALQNLLAVRQDLVEAERNPDRATEIAGRARATIEETARGLRELVASVHPVTLEHAGLDAALRSIAGFHGARGGFEVVIAVDEDASSRHDALVVRIARELLANAEKHAAATRVDVSGRREDGMVVLQIEDNGRGMAPGRAAAALREGHIGLASAAERIRALAGTFDLWSEPGGGTRVRVTLPQPPS